MNTRWMSSSAPAILTAATLAVTSLATVATPSAAVAAARHDAGSGCLAEYTTQFNGTIDGEQQFRNTVVVTNLGSDLDRWRLAVDLADPGQRVLQVEPGEWKQSGSTLIVASSDQLAAEESVSVRFEGVTTGGNPPPTGYVLNGMVCAASTPGLIEVTGMVEQGVEVGCLMLNPGNTTPTHYQLVGGPRDVIRPGARLLVYGYRLADYISYCMQGVPLKVASAQPLTR